jgi:hypothetical protein
MEPVTSAVLAALAAGAAAAAKDTASVAIKDAYTGLKALVQRRFAGKPEAEVALKAFESDPETWEKPLSKSLAETGADKDEEIIQRADQVLKLVQPQQTARGKYNVQIGEGKGVQIGDHGRQENRFGND